MSEVSAPVFRWVQENGSWTPVEAGQLVHDPQLRLWRFTFASSYLARGDDAWELDPHWISTKTRSPFSQTFQVAAGLFADLAVTGWSYDLLKKHYPGSDSWSWWDRIVRAPLDNFGALIVGDPDKKINLADKALEALQGLTREDLARFASDTSSGFMGGERPKICVTSQGQRAIVKFPGRGEPEDLAIAEAAALTLGAQLGMDVPAHKVVRYSTEATPALHIERFDRPHGTGYAQCVSAATAIGLEPNTVREDSRRSYLALRGKLRHPDDWTELFRRVVLNAAVANGDDHPWNHSLRQQGRSEWRLSPLYDVMPNRHQGGVTTFAMAIGRSGERQATLANLLQFGHSLRLGAEQAQQEIDRIFDHVLHHWKDVFVQHANAAQVTPNLQDWSNPFEGSIAAIRVRASRE